MVFLMNLGRVVFAPLLEPLRDALTVSTATLGLLATLAWLGSALSRVPTGYLLTRVSRQRAVFGTGTLLTGAAVLTAVAPSVPVLLVGAFALGLASGAYFVAANPLISELFPEGVGQALGIHGMASQVAAAGAPLVVSAVLVVGDWRTAFQAIAVVAALATVAFTLVARRMEFPSAGTADNDFLGAAREQYRIVLAGVAILGFAGFVWNGLFNFYVTYLTATKSIGEPMARNLLTVVFAAGVPAFGVSGRLADRLPLVPYLLVVLVGFAGAVLLLTATTGLLALVAVSVALGYVVHSLFPAVDTLLLGSLPDRHRASAYAVYSGSMMAVQAMGSVVVGTLTDAGFGFDPVLRTLVAALLVVVTAIAVTYALGRFPTGARG
ncbi:MFS transporter [Halorientalis litorea]|uniref:MFS transporter n=1 Tax=Halorientalis litorea TaxID=2931977 RepID=UPI001FF3025F|nr:MFS transporter [Halorientalis litorea]